MSLLQNEDFLIWQLRSSYLTNVKDGIGERLIHLDCGILNNPSFRAAGWTASGADLRRTHSPPIPTTITSDYFSGPPRSAVGARTNFDEEDEGGIVTGRGNTDTVGPGPEIRRRRRREQQREDDSSDLSDESDEDNVIAPRAAQQIKFAKMPLRNRAGSSPIRQSKAKDGVEVLITSPSKRSAEGRLRSGSIDAIEAIKQRARKGTLTSSDMSSENELDPGVFKRRQVNSRKAIKTAKVGIVPPDKGGLLQLENPSTTIDEDSAEYSDRTSLSSEFGATADSGSILNHISDPQFFPMDPVQTTISFSTESPKKSRGRTSMLQALPPSRPISTIQPKSLLGQAIRARRSKPKNPLESFVLLSGKGVLDPLNIRMYAPFSEQPATPFEVPLVRIIPSGGTFGKEPVLVADAIGLSLWRYCEEQLQPPLEALKLSVNRWTLRMMEDGEVDYDFPALSRNKPIGDFTSNNNRAARGRSKEKSYDEFALVEATDAQTKENQVLTPKYDKLIPAVTDYPLDKPTDKTQTPQQVQGEVTQTPQQVQGEVPQPVISTSTTLMENPIYIRADRSTMPSSQLIPRAEPFKVINVHYTSLEAVTQTTNIEITTETYLAEVLDAVCSGWKLDKAWHIFKVTGTNTVAPGDRTVEALGNLTDLDLVQRRFAKEGNVGFVGSPSSTSPHTPLLLTSSTPPRKGGKRGVVGLQMQPLIGLNQEHLSNNVVASGRYKKYNVTRKQPMSFAPSHQRILLMDEDYMHILPTETSKTLFESSGSKVNRVPFSMIVGCKVSRRHPKTFRVIIFRDHERETKRYDFEALNQSEAAEIVDEITRGMEPYHCQRMGLGIT